MSEVPLYGVRLARISGRNVTNFQCKLKERNQFRNVTNFHLAAVTAVEVVGAGGDRRAAALRAVRVFPVA